MFPVLFSIGNIAVSSFGIFLVLGFLYGLFLIWRLTRAWDLNEEKILDITLLTFVGGLIGARLYFVIVNLQYFAASPMNIILINKAPGFSFWGGFLGGWLTLFFFARRKRFDFWQLADIAFVGFLGGLIFSEIGCFLGGCNIGITSKAFFAVTQVGFVGKRLPIQLLEGLLLTLSLMKIWAQATHFHQRGKIAGLGLIMVGIIQLILEPFKQNHSAVIFPVLFVILGVVILYRIKKQNPVVHLKAILASSIRFFVDSKARKGVVQNIVKSCYNQKITIGWKLKNLRRNH